MIDIVSERISKTIKENEKLLVGYALSGYPGSKEFFKLLKILEDSSLDVLELGFASANPYSDGDVIASAHRAVDRTLCCSLPYWREIRENTRKPIWIMAYEKDFIESGIYMDFCGAKVIDGIVIPDLEEKKRISLIDKVRPYGVDVIGFTNPDMSDSELDDVFSTFPLVYEQLYVGQTGKGSSSEMYHHMLDKSLEYPGVIGCAGFGISTKEQVERNYREGFHGVIIGTAIVKHLNQSFSALEEYLSDIGRAKSSWR